MTLTPEPREFDMILRRGPVIIYINYYQNPSTHLNITEQTSFVYDLTFDLYYDLDLNITKVYVSLNTFLCSSEHF